MYTNAEILGRLVRDPELKQTNNGKSVVNFSLASNRGDEVDYFDVTAWGNVAESVAAHKNQGDLVLVRGKLRQERWQQDGQTRTQVKVVANEVVFVSSKGENAPKSGDDASDFKNDIPF